ncbi:MAG: hypothetical protein WC939_02395 [Acholeplasmataceae bacterium]
MKKINRKSLILNSVIILVGLVILVWSSFEFLNHSKYKTTYVLRDVVETESLSKYSPNLKNTSADSKIYIIKGEESGPSVLILGGTHANEAASNLTATLMLENLTVTKGTVYIMTEANGSAMTNTFPQEGTRQFYDIETPFGHRRFKYGSRATSFTDQWPNPEIYVHPQSDQKLSTGDAGNLNRAYPGVKDGTITEQIAYGIIELIKQNDITITIDLHEASPEYLTNNAIVSHDNPIAMDIAAKAFMTLEFQNIIIKTETSPKNLRGLTHREVGDYTNSLAFLLESSNASQGRLRGAFTNDLIVTGEDKFYDKADELGLLFAKPVHINERVARHTATIMAILKGFNDNPISTEKGKFEINNVPNYDDIINNGVGFYLLNPNK